MQKQNALPYNVSCTVSPQTASVSSYQNINNEAQQQVEKLRQQVSILEAQLKGARNEIFLNHKATSKWSGEVDALVEQQKDEASRRRSESRQLEADLRSTLELNELQKDIISKQQERIQSLVDYEERRELEHQKEQIEFERKIAHNDERIKALINQVKQATEQKTKVAADHVHRVLEFCQESKRQQIKHQQKPLNKVCEEGQIRGAQLDEIYRRIIKRRLGGSDVSHKSSKKIDPKSGHKRSNLPKNKRSRRIRSEDRSLSIISSNLDNSSWQSSQFSSDSEQYYHQTNRGHRERRGDKSVYQRSVRILADEVAENEQSYRQANRG